MIYAHCYDSINFVCDNGHGDGRSRAVAMLKISLSIGSEVISTNEVSAKMLSFIGKGAQVTLSADAGELDGCRACAVSALIDTGVVQQMQEPKAVLAPCAPAQGGLVPCETDIQKAGGRHIG